MISIVACCHSAKLCAYAARDFRSQQYTNWRGLLWIHVVLSQKLVGVYAKEVN